MCINEQNFDYSSMITYKFSRFDIIICASMSRFVFIY